jgi:hypothetical protein
VGFVGGLIRREPWARMTFEFWEDDPRGGIAVNIADPDIRQRRTQTAESSWKPVSVPAELLAGVGQSHVSALDLTPDG